MISSDIIASQFVVFRGDSFQGVLSRPDEAFRQLKKLEKTSRKE